MSAVLEFPKPLSPVPVEATLIASRGTKLYTREQLTQFPVPEATRTFKPVSHAELVRAIIECLGFRHLHVVKDEYAVSDDGHKMFGVMEVDVEWSNLRFAIALRNGNDRSMRLAVTCGYRVFCCSNMSFYGQYHPLLAKHSHGFNLIEAVSVGVDRIQRNFDPLRRQIETWMNTDLSDDDARLILYKAFIERGLPLPAKLLREAHQHYFEPEYEEFQPRTLYSLSNAFTSAFKLLDPLRQHPATARLAGFLSRFE
jgi:hypothetical protein